MVLKIATRVYLSFYPFPKIGFSFSQVNRHIVDVFDPLAYAGSLLAIVTACALASFIPALRAARIDPMRILRQE